MEYHYLKLANDLESKIRLGRYKAREKLPSLRVMRRQGLVLFDRAGEENITIVPGSLCSATDNYRHCIRLNFGYPWTKESEKGVRVLGGIISELMEEHEIE
ncbi:MAG: hypothetical protein GQ542_16525 [Desulforhopalus sp.]|nr:hypothetical protein [Desulforhopalus sp.]